MRKRCVYLILLVGAVAVAVVLAVFFTRSREVEPVYRGIRLSQWVAYEMPPRKRKLNSVVSPMIDFQSWNLTDDRNVIRSYGAEGVLNDLGTNAEGAIGDLSRVVNGTKPSESRIRAVHVLSGLGKADLPVLVGVLTNQQAHGDKWTAETPAIAGFIGIYEHVDPSLARGAIPALRHMLKNQDPGIRSAATNALLKIDPQALATRGAQ